MKRARLSAALAIVVALAGCGQQAARGPRHLTPFPGQLVLLPLDNQSVSLAGPVLVRKLLEEHLNGSNYHLMAADQVDTKLRAIGITDGGQVKSATTAKLGEALGADALLVGELLTFKYTNIGVYAKRAVEVHLKLVVASTGEVIWEDTKKESNTKLGLSSEGIRDNLVAGLATELVEKALKSPLRPEADAVSLGLVRGVNRTRHDW